MAKLGGRQAAASVARGFTLELKFRLPSCGFAVRRRARICCSDGAARKRLIVSTAGRANVFAVAQVWAASDTPSEGRRVLERRLGSLVQFVRPGAEPEVDDAELVRAFSKGESWAARLIWARHAPMVYRLLARALGPQGDAADLTQEVFLNTFVRLPGLRDVGALRSFIYSIALRTLKWELRRRRVRRILHFFPSEQLPEVPVQAADSEARQILMRFYTLLDQLTANERTAFVLRHMENFKLEEVAERMGVSLATAKRWLSRASQSVSALVEVDVVLSSYSHERRVSNARR